MTENLVKSTPNRKKDKVFSPAIGCMQNAYKSIWHGAGCTFRANPGIAKSPAGCPLGVIFGAYLFSPYLGR